MRTINYKKIYNRIKDFVLSKDIQGLNNMLTEVFVDVEDYNEELSVLTSQALVQVVIDGFNDNNVEEIDRMLVALHLKFGSHNGGCVLYDYVPETDEDLRKLMKCKLVSKLFEDNRKMALSKDFYFDPRLIFAINWQDEKFMKKVEKRHPEAFRSLRKEGVLEF